MNNDFIRYMELLGIRIRHPSIELLTQIVKAHITRIPFENISKLFYLKTDNFAGIVDLPQFIDGISKYHFGGTCYTCNYYLNTLLLYLGFDAKLCGADMSKPDVHVVNIVNLQGKEYLVDVGYAAPFFEPIPLDKSDDFIIDFGNDRYVFKPKDPSGRTRLIHYRDRIARHGYLVNPKPRTIDEFSAVIAESFDTSATFMNALLLVKFDSDSACVIHNMIYTEIKNSIIQNVTLKNHEDIANIILKKFRIPAAITNVALEGLTFSKNAWN